MLATVRLEIFCRRHCMEDRMDATSYGSQFSVVSTDVVGAGKGFVGDRRRPQHKFSISSTENTRALPLLRFR